MEYVDLHTHTTASDGIYSPRKLIDIAVSKGVRAIAITDHDTVGSISEALDYASTMRYTVFPGIEYSVDYSRGSLHLVGLNIDHDYAPMLEELERLNDMRRQRAYRMIDDLRKHGFDVTAAEVEDIARGAAIGRPHIARIMVRKGYAKDMTDVFQRFLIKGKPGYVKKEKISLEKAVELINGAGGIPVLAHPLSLEYKDGGDFEELLMEFISKGVRGIEVYAGMHTVKAAEKYMEFAKRYGLLVSGGSDFHGDKNEAMGCYAGNVPIPVSILDAVEELTGRAVAW